MGDEDMLGFVFVRNDKVVDGSWLEKIPWRNLTCEFVKQIKPFLEVFREGD